MNIMILFIIANTIVIITLIVGALAISIEAQTPTTSDLPMTTINETNSTVKVLNKTLPAENETDVIPVVPM
ncbi:hypothetical protein [Candidatus Nitrosocosmicus arcticus]|uniref:Uncharacterized protein n=1 Tax=Candidatus Nitrosocosmicus arcticus TaxID=2035267 RepID=A0A557SRX5_9ARCH|nr:hypothetical protein [Candidatus Nitrosocosmicus arcticus]TVP39348.1 hypothetical protein NARC_160062 [Candidatus Nitrosocosmicus arcticus]